MRYEPEERYEIFGVADVLADAAHAGFEAVRDLAEQIVRREVARREEAARSWIADQWPCPRPNRPPILFATTERPDPHEGCLPLTVETQTAVEMVHEEDGHLRYLVAHGLPFGPYETRTFEYYRVTYECGAIRDVRNEDWADSWTTHYEARLLGPGIPWFDSYDGLSLEQQTVRPEDNPYDYGGGALVSDLIGVEHIDRAIDVIDRALEEANRDEANDD